MNNSGALRPKPKPVPVEVAPAVPNPNAVGAEVVAADVVFVPKEKVGAVVFTAPKEKPPAEFVIM